MGRKNSAFDKKRERRGFIQRFAKHKRRNGILTFILLIIMIGVVSMAAVSDPSPVGHFRSYEGELAYKEAYNEAMKLLPTPSKTIDLDTDFGTVRVYEFKNDHSISDIPLVLLPGRSSGVPMWSQNLNDLVKDRTVYAFDALGDAGMCVQTKKIENAADQALWLEQVFEQLELHKFHLAGHSFGGWNAANYAVHYPNRVVTLELLEPVYVFVGLRWEFYIKSIPAAIPFLPQSWRDKMLADIGGTSEIDLNDPVARMISEATKHFSLALPLPEQITPEQLSGLDMPVYAALAEKSALHDAQKACENAKAYVKRADAKVWKGASHSLPMEFTEQLDNEMLMFMTENESLLDERQE